AVTSPPCCKTADPCRSRSSAKRRLSTLHNGHATQALLGVTVPAAQPDDTAAVVQQVTPGTAAAAAGIHPGDMITRVDDRLIDSGDALIAAIRSHTPGAQATLTVKNSAGASRQVHVTLGTQQVVIP